MPVRVGLSGLALSWVAICGALSATAIAQPSAPGDNGPVAPTGPSSGAMPVAAAIVPITDKEPVVDVDLLRASDGTLHAIYTVAPSYVMPKVMHRTSRDGGASWSEAASLNPVDTVGVMTNVYCPPPTALIDGSGRLYVVYMRHDRAANQTQVAYHVFANGAWSDAIPLGTARSGPAPCFFACVDPSGRAHAVWTEKYQYRAKPEDSPWEKENGLIYESTLDGASASAARLVHEPRFAADPRYPGNCDRYRHIAGIVDGAGRVQYVAWRDQSPEGKPEQDIGLVYFNGEQQQMLWPSYDAQRQVDREFHVMPQLVADAAGNAHVIVSSTKDQPPSLYDLDLSKGQYTTVLQIAGPKPTMQNLQVAGITGGGGGIAVTVSVNGNYGSYADPLDVVLARLDAGSGTWTAPRALTNNAQAGSAGSGAILDWSNVQTGSTSQGRGIAASTFVAPDGSVDALLHLEVTGMAISDLGGTSNSTLVGSGTTTALAFSRIAP